MMGERARDENRERARKSRLDRLSSRMRPHPTFEAQTATTPNTQNRGVDTANSRLKRSSLSRRSPVITSVGSTNRGGLVHAQRPKERKQKDETARFDLDRRAAS